MPEYHVDLGTLDNGEMRRLDLEGKAVILAQVEGELFAFRATCTHYGGPLNEGVLKGYTVMCPWHHACFDIRSGSRAEPPALNDLPVYPVRKEGGQAIITLPDSPAAPAPTDIKEEDQRTFVIIGGGAAGNAAAEALRRGGFGGRVILLSAAPNVPIDRPNLSKDYLDGHAKPEWMPLRSPEWYAARAIEVRLNSQVIGIEPQAYTITLANHETLSYDKLLLATGAAPRLLDAPGVRLKGVFTLRSLEDADAIIAAVGEGTQVVIVGASFIGMEVAAALVGGRKVAATIVAPEPIPFEPIFGEQVGQLLQQEHTAKGVEFRLGNGVRQLNGAEGQVQSVELSSGEVLPADVVIIGVGVRPATDFLKTSGLVLDGRDGSVLVNAQMQTNYPDIYAAGDIALIGAVRVEHWRVAQQQGIVAAQHMLGLPADINQHVPFFWSQQWGVTLTTVGHATHWDEIVYRGDVMDKDFIAFYVAKGELLAAVGCNRDKELAAIEFILQDNLPLTVDQMRDAGFDLVALATGN